MTCPILNFKYTASPNPPIEYDQQYVRQLIRVLELYFNQLDNWNLQVYNSLQDICMTPLPVSIGGTNIDAFGRLRVSNPLTLFDSSHRYADNNLWANSITGT